MQGSVESHDNRILVLVFSFSFTASNSIHFDSSPVIPSTDNTAWPTDFISVTRMSFLAMDRKTENSGMLLFCRFKEWVQLAGAAATVLRFAGLGARFSARGHMVCHSTVLQPNTRPICVQGHRKASRYGTLPPNNSFMIVGLSPRCHSSKSTVVRSLHHHHPLFSGSIPQNIRTYPPPPRYNLLELFRLSQWGKHRPSTKRTRR